MRINSKQNEKNNFSSEGVCFTLPSIDIIELSIFVYNAKYISFQCKSYQLSVMPWSIRFGKDPVVVEQMS